MSKHEVPLNREELQEADDGRQPSDAERRAALSRLGPLAILTPVGVMSLLVSKRASAQLGSPPCDPPNCPP
jgi:hypothetical protein